MPGVHKKAAPGGAAFSKSFLELENTLLRGHVFLVDRGWGELQSVEPDHLLHVVAVRPEGMEVVVRADGNVGVVAEERAAESVAAVDGLGRDEVRRTARGQVDDVVVET